MLTLTLLGPFHAQVDGHSEPLRLPTQKSVALLAYLALNHDGAVSRDVLASMLWNDVPLRQGRHSLRQELTHIRTALGPTAADHLYADRSSVALRREHIRVDSERMVELVAQHTSDSMREACTLYQGELLKGINTRERPFENWLESTRRDISRLAIIALEFRLDELTRLGDAAEALKVARQLFTIDPESDTPYRRMMSIYGTGEEGGGSQAASTTAGERRKS